MYIMLSGCCISPRIRAVADTPAAAAAAAADDAYDGDDDFD